MPKGKATNGKSKLQALEKAVGKVLAALSAAEKEMEGQDLESLTPDDRAHSSGRLRDGEDAAMTAILDTVDKHTGLFAALAPHDHGKDDAVVETWPAREALARRALLAPLAKKLDGLLTRVSDDMLASGEKAKDVTVPAYAIIKANVAMSPGLRTSAAPAIGFYTGQARRGRGKKKPETKSPSSASNGK